jgi:hypothetical protein
VVGVFEGQRLSPSAQALDRLSHGYIVNILKGGDMKSAPGQTLCLYNVPRLNYDRVLLVRCGKQKELDGAKYRKALNGAAIALASLGVKEAVSFLPELEVKDRDLAWRLRQTVEAMRDAHYRFDRLKSKKEGNGAPQLRRLTLNIAEADELEDARRAVRQGQAIANGVALTKDLGNLPGNICTPSYLADEARKLAQRNAKLSVKILTEKEMTALKMGSLLSVARGHRRRDPHRRLRRCAGQTGQRTVRQRRGSGAEPAPGRHAERRPRLATAAVGGIPGAAQEQLRRHGQRGGPRRRRHHRGLLPVALHQAVSLGAPRHCRHRLAVGQQQGRHRPAGPAADPVPDRPGPRVKTFR